MKLITITFLGLFIWLLTLIWPEVNLWLSPAVVLGAVIGLGSVVIGYLSYQQRQQDALVPERVMTPVRPADTHPLKTGKPSNSITVVSGEIRFWSGMIALLTLTEERLARFWAAGK